MFVADGEVRAAFAHLEHRTTPALGGASVLRESIPMPEDLYKSSVRLVTEVGLEGICEVEFAADRDGHPLLMEINARLAGTVETTLHAGIDFPLMVWQWAVGEGGGFATSYETGMRMRWFAATCVGCATTTAGSVGPTASLGPRRPGPLPQSSSARSTTTASIGMTLVRS